ncbi:hypothetical protein REC12_11880 [Desulfosporosinus sp. PR]|uniref:hypothetical protein n=1 Tax=Candidatus Desulfosporosinus nitrosoreducens TaxID=3401928 RepID=UPI0027F4AF12|nr:hypothetical protein [Desulfosporosinus sp. PR]MDQ7094289.1 hypothetical protein [Desulfosporosinus sp. PR]
MLKTAYDDFKHSACFDCAYCKEGKLPESEAGMLDIRKFGVVKIWCYAANNAIAIMTAMEKEDCPYRAMAKNE